MSSRVHILGICGTFMGVLHSYARAGLSGLWLGCECVPTYEYDAPRRRYRHRGWILTRASKSCPDLVVIGNALSRGNAAVEYVHNGNTLYLRAAMAGRITHKSLGDGDLGHPRENHNFIHADLDSGMRGKEPGFLVGGVPFGFEGSARLGSGPFVVEADEYDSAFFDKRSKFVHYRPKTLVINNLEFDHADIFEDLGAIQTQFHHLIRCVPSSGKIIAAEGEAIDNVLDRGVWTRTERMGVGNECAWTVEGLTVSYSQVRIRTPHGEEAEIAWSLIGRHNAENALSAVSAAAHAGVPLEVACDALSKFEGVKRRLELLGRPAGVSVYDDFAHHPTAIASTLSGIRSAVGAARVIAVVELRSNTMKDGTHRDALLPATQAADVVFWFQPEVQTGRSREWRCRSKPHGV